MLDGLIIAMASRGIDLAALGAAYLAFLGNLALTIAFFAASRSWLVISPNRPAKHYGMYVVVVTASLVIATALENELGPRPATLSYAAVPHFSVLLLIHLWTYYKQEPWLIALAASANAAAVATVAAAAIVADHVPAAHWLGAALMIGLLTYFARYSISTKRGFINAKSIYTSSKERAEERAAPQVPWLGLSQWIALIAASVVLATLNAVVRGGALSDLPTAAVAGESTLMLAVTAFVCAVPASAYWLAHRHWMPELTRFVWLVWLVVGFAFTYTNFLTNLDRA
jgi:hypothetical protein